MATRWKNPMRILNADEVLDIPVPDGLSGYELVDGELEPVMPANPRHGRIAAKVARLVDAYAFQHGIGGEVYVESGYVLSLKRDRERLRGPDVSFVSKEKLDGHGGEPAKGFFRLVPDFVVEVDSPDNSGNLQARIHDYLDAGVTLLWVIHLTTHSATVYHRDGSARLVRGTDSLDGAELLPGFTLPLTELFPA
jgi:Uma2 family endonuclease